jgi:glycosyltransferase involved in cell wall biosynthesis
VRRYTEYPDYQIIVYDDCSDNGADLLYLREKQKQGWLKLIEGKEHKDHGGALNVLINETCKTDLAMILDCDIQILRSRWLTDMVNSISQDEKAIGICNCLGIKERGEGVYVGPFCEFWFGLLNMNIYRNGMQVDWMPKIILDKEEMKKYIKNIDVNTLDYFVLDVGSKLYVKILYDNPKGYYFISPLPEYIKSGYRHYAQITSLSKETRADIKKHMDWQFITIKKELEKLRQ